MKSRPESLIAALEASPSTMQHRQEQARQLLIRSVREDLEGLPECLLEDEDVPTYRLSRLRTVALFPLGEYRYVWLNTLSGRTTLHLGKDGLYEYGPARISASDIDPFGDNSMSLRPVKIDSLTIGDLRLIQDLLRRVWLV